MLNVFLRLFVLGGLLMALGTSANAQLLHRYEFNSTNDSVGTAHGTLRGSATISGGSLNTTAVAGGLLGGVPQNGVMLPSSAVAGITNAFTIETWFVANYGGGYATLFSFSSNNTANYVLATPARGNSPFASTVSVIGGGGSTTEQQASAQYQDNGVLHNMIVTYDGNTLAYYIDGALGSFSGLSPTITDPGLNLSTLPYIGINGGSPWPDNSINGSTLDFRIYGQALTTFQVANLYALGADASSSAITAILTNATANSVVVDSAIALTNYTGLGEWNTNGNFEGWTSNGVSGASVTGGTLSGTGGAAVAQISKLSFAGGPDLDLGFNDVLDLRIQVPASFAGDIRVYYGTSNTTGISSSRMLSIPNAVIVKDGAAHVYRFSLGLEVYWRGHLTDLRIELTGASGVAFAVDYLRVGDLTGEIYQPRFTTECPATGGTTPAAALFGPGQSVYSMESKHFRILWNDGVAAHGSWTATMAHGTLRNAEECWQVLVKKLGYREPCFAIGTQSGTKCKLNITTWHGGYWAGGDDFGGTSFARLNITPDGLRENPPTGVLPHEFTHCIQFHNTTGYVPGAWWEGHANYGQERYLQHFGVLYASNQRSCIDPTYLRCAHQTIAHGRDYYLSWPMFLYLDENPDGLSDLGEGTMVKLWQQTQINEYPLMALERLTPANNIKDIVGYFARRQATYNYKSKTDINAALANFGAPLDNAATARWQFTDLVQRNDDTNWWRVPFEMAPMQGAYAIHELVPIGSGVGRVVTVNLHGLPDSARGADWRASFIVIADNGTERYSTLWGSGTNSVTLAANENKVYLSVAGAPATFYGPPNNHLEGDFDDTLFPYRSFASKTRFPYEIQVTGATPKHRDNGGTSGLTQHSNGGGYRSVSVPASVYIGPNARVLGGSVSGNARIEDYGLVTAGTVNGNAVIGGHAWVRGGTVNGNAKVRDWALVEGGTVTGSARILEHGNFKGGTAQDLSTVKGTAATLSGTLSGNAIIDGDYGDFFSGRDVSNGVAFGHVPYVGVPDSHIRPLPLGLYASYDFAAAHDSRVLDQYGVTDSFHQGSPVWSAGDGRRAGFLAFNGTNQYVVLDRSLSDLRLFTVAVWVKWSGGSGNQPVFYLGSATNKCLYVTPDDGTGHAKLSIANGSAPQTLASVSSLPVGVWTHVAVTLDGTNAAFYVNGTLAASAANTNRADQLLAANTATNLQQNYLGRGTGGSLPFFQGALDDVRFYATALSASDIAALQPPPAPVGTGTLYVDLRATNASSGSATTFTTWTNFGSSIGNFTKTGTTTYTNNVVGTQIPGVLFNGTSGLYSSANTSLADITGAGDRTIEVWAYNPALASEETMVSLGDRSGVRKDCAFNFGNAAGWGAVTHFGDDVPWDSLPSANAWHHLVYIYDGTTNVQIYVDGVLSTTDTLDGVLLTPTGDPINIGCQRNTAGGGTAGQFFSGYLNTVRVWGGAMTASQVAANYLFGPWPLVQPPAMPTGLVATSGDGSAVLNWTASSGATSYRVKRSFVSGGPYTVLTTNLTTTYTNTGLANGTAYHYVVSAVNADGESANSTQVSAQPTLTTPPNIAEWIYALTADNQLISFGSTTPGSILAAYTVSGLQANEKIVGLDFWNGTLYGLGDLNNLYTINRANGAAGLVGSFSPTMNGEAFGFEAEPGGLRLVSNLDQNLLLAYADGTATVGPTLNGSPNPAVTGLAYHPGNGQRYVADYSQNTIGLLDAASGLVSTIGLAGIDFSRHNGFDISSNPGGAAYLASPASSSGLAANLYKVDLTTGSATLIGLIGLAGDDTLIRGLAVGPGYVELTPTNLTFSASGDQLTLSWPVDHTGWRLETQTNSLATGLGTNWFDVSGSSLTNNVVMPVNVDNASVFYRLIYP